MLLAGDLGGTKTDLAVYSAEAGPRFPLAAANYTSAKYSGLAEIVRMFQEKFKLPIDRAVFGVAGPVVGGHANITNIGWDLDEKTLAADLDLERVTLINDLVAIGTAIPHLADVDIITLHPGTPEPGGNIAVLAPGTGLGEAFLTWDAHRKVYVAHPSEGGHVDFAPNSSQEIEMLRYLFDRFGHVSYERVASGSGIPNIYDFLRDTGAAQEPEWLASQLAQVSDRTPLIINTALDSERYCDICRKTLHMFVDVLASEAGNLALKYLATGGVYLGGGIPPRILKVLREPHFTATFINKGRFSQLLERIPVHVILNSKSALFGAAVYGLEDRNG